MDIALADQHIFVLDDRLTPDDIRQRAMDRRTGAFGGGLEIGRASCRERV
jgi:hypothetical protein